MVSNICILALVGQKYEDHEFEASVSYMARLSPNTKQTARPSKMWKWNAWLAFYYCPFSNSDGSAFPGEIQHHHPPFLVPWLYRAALAHSLIGYPSIMTSCLPAADCSALGSETTMEEKQVVLWTRGASGRIADKNTERTHADFKPL